MALGCGGFRAKYAARPVCSGYAHHSISVRGGHIGSSMHRTSVLCSLSQNGRSPAQGIRIEDHRHHRRCWPPHGVLPGAAQDHRLHQRNAIAVPADLLVRKAARQRWLDPQADETCGSGSRRQSRSGQSESPARDGPDLQGNQGRQAPSARQGSPPGAQRLHPAPAVFSGGSSGSAERLAKSGWRVGAKRSSSRRPKVTKWVPIGLPVKWNLHRIHTEYSREGGGDSFRCRHGCADSGARRRTPPHHAA